MTKLADAFISFNGSDAPFVKTIVDALTGAGLHIWMDSNEIKVGERWLRSIEQVLSSVPAVLACIGPVAPDRWCRQEIEVALIRKESDPEFQIIPLLLPGADIASIPPFLAVYSALRITNPSDDSQILSIVKAIHRTSSGQKRIEWPEIFRDASKAQ